MTKEPIDINKKRVREAKEPSVYSIKCEISERALNWFLNQNEIMCRIIETEDKADVHYYQVLDQEVRIVKRVDSGIVYSNLLYFATKESEVIAKQKMTPQKACEFAITRNAVWDIVSRVESIIKNEDVPIKMHRFKAIAQKNEDTFCLARLSFDTDIIGSPEHAKIAIEELESSEILGPILTGIKQNFIDHDGSKSLMWDILCCWIGKGLLEDSYSREFLYWYGEGMDGKGSLMDLLVRKLGSNTTTAIEHSRLEERFGSAIYADKRFVLVDEVPSGNFMTNHLKAITGSQFIAMERKGKDVQFLDNRILLGFFSNHKPSFDGSNAHLSRLRYIESKPRQTKDLIARQAIACELDGRWDTFSWLCAAKYIAYGLTIPKTDDDNLEYLKSNYEGEIDVIIAQYFEYNPDSFLSNQAINHFFRAKGCKKTAKLDQKICEFFEHLGDKEQKVKKFKCRTSAKLSPVHGVLNVFFRNEYDALPYDRIVKAGRGKVATKFELI